MGIEDITQQIHQAEVLTLQKDASLSARAYGLYSKALKAAEALTETDCSYQTKRQLINTCSNGLYTCAERYNQPHQRKMQSSNSCHSSTASLAKSLASTPHSQENATCSSVNSTPSVRAALLNTHISNLIDTALLYNLESRISSEKNPVTINVNQRFDCDSLIEQHFFGPRY